MLPIVVCTVSGKCLPVLEASVKAYAPQSQLISHHVERSTFGECYNHAMAQAFKDYDEIIIANDDVVLNPNTYETLIEDVEMLKDHHGKLLGLVAACSDNVRNIQNIRYNPLDKCIRSQAVSPLFAWVSKHAFEAAQFPNTNWFSDDLMCEDLNRRGFANYASRAYVHHAGSQTVGSDIYQLYLDAINWIEINRPEYVAIFKR